LLVFPGDDQSIMVATCSPVTPPSFGEDSAVYGFVALGNEQGVPHLLDGDQDAVDHLILGHPWVQTDVGKPQSAHEYETGLRTPKTYSATESQETATDHRRACFFADLAP